MIRLSASHEREMRSHGEAAFPEECCGALLGTETGGVKIVTEIRQAANTREDSPQNRYLIAPEELLRIERDAREQGLDVLGYYHSHPNAPARPSAYDRDHAWPWVSYVIVSVMNRHAAELTSWVFHEPDAPFERERIEIEPR